MGKPIEKLVKKSKHFLWQLRGLVRFQADSA
jgi:hypothetical protein